MRNSGKPLKRIIDLLLASVLLIVLSPLCLLTAAAILVCMGRPVLFRQNRPGLNGRAFELLKFRTMTDARDDRGQVLPDEKRLTGLGRLLRRTSLDELPQLVNIIRGDMSLVGPRPLLMEYLDRYTEEQSRRHTVKPGITGWAQINGRNALSWEDKFRLDVWYVDNRSIWLDIKILLITIWKVLRGEGISQEGHATAQPFRGSKQ